MKNVLFAAGAAIVVTLSTAAASAGQFAAPGGAGAGAVVRVDDHRYYDDGYYDNGYNGGNDWQYRYQNDGYGYGDGSRWRDGYGDRGPVSPGWIVRNLERSDYRYISRPLLSGKFYQVKAISPNGKKVKLYIDAYSGQIVRVKS
jgi:hypothetical protein